MRGSTHGGFFVLEPSFSISSRPTKPRGNAPPSRASPRVRQLSAFRHAGFWRPMDTLRDKQYLEELWDSGRAPWKRW